jgi:DNA-binding LytR/AlgR family response regulator
MLDEVGVRVMSLKTLIVDDEPMARAVMREELDLLPEVEVVGEATDGATALAQIRARQPDLVLLDLQMPGMGGFDVIRHLHSSRRFPAVVIVTAYDQHAIQAFEAGAIDYLLKPVGPDRLAEAIQRAARLQPEETAARLAAIREIGDSNVSPVSRRIVARSGEEYLLLDADEVLAFMAEGEIVWIMTAKKKLLATQTLKTIQEKLRGSSFRRIHRNSLVNLNHVRKMSPLSSQRWLVTLSNALEFVVSKRQARNVRELFTW